MKHLIPLPIICFLLTGFTGCEKPTEPKDTPEPDTTSHNFVWRVDTLGTFVSNVRDVGIVNENDIWAVGEFYKKHSTFDSTTKDHYNAARWDGVRWELKRYYPQTYVDFLTGSTPDFPYEINSIWIFSADNIFMVSYAGSYIWIRNGEVKTRYIENRSGGMTKIWAKDENNIWIVGEKGTIIYYNGTSFTKIPYDESVDFVDIWGDETGVVRAVGEMGQESKIYKITGLTISEELNTLAGPSYGNPEGFQSIWFDKTFPLFIGDANGFYSWDGKSFNGIFPNGLSPDDNRGFYARGSSSNNILVVGLFGQVFHYNGYSVFRWNFNSDKIDFRSVSVKGMVCAAGGKYYGSSIYEQTKGAVAIGIRK